MATSWYSNLMTPCEKVKFSIEFVDNSDDTIGLNGLLSAKDYYVFNNDQNYNYLVKLCKTLCLLSDKEIKHIDECVEIRKFGMVDRLQKLSDHIQTGLKTTENQKRVILNNVLENLMLSDKYNLEEYTAEVQHEKHIKPCEIRTTDKSPEIRSVVPIYSMCKRNRGVLFFVNIIHFPNRPTATKYRHGAQHDKYYLISLFRKFGYKIYYYENLLLKTFLMIMNKLMYTCLNDTESLVFVVASHGNENNEIELYNGDKLNIYEILFNFKNRNCPTMVGKPKVFMFPCCRGSNSDYGISKITTLDTDGGDDINSKLPTYSDILICFATIHGFVTKRTADYGNCYIEAFYRVLAGEAYKHDIETMLFTVTEVLQKICGASCSSERKWAGDPLFKYELQTPCNIRWDFNKLLYFNPGYIVEDD